MSAFIRVILVIKQGPEESGSHCVALRSPPLITYLWILVPQRSRVLPLIQTNHEPWKKSPPRLCLLSPSPQGFCSILVACSTITRGPVLCTSKDFITPHNLSILPVNQADQFPQCLSITMVCGVAVPEGFSTHHELKNVAFLCQRPPNATRCFLSSQSCLQFHLFCSRSEESQLQMGICKPLRFHSLKRVGAQEPGLRGLQSPPPPPAAFSFSILTTLGYFPGQPRGGGGAFPALIAQTVFCKMI